MVNRRTPRSAMTKGVVLVLVLVLVAVVVRWSCLIMEARRVKPYTPYCYNNLATLKEKMERYHEMNKEYTTRIDDLLFDPRPRGRYQDVFSFEILQADQESFVAVCYGSVENLFIVYAATNLLPDRYRDALVSFKGRLNLTEQLDVRRDWRSEVVSILKPAPGETPAGSPAESH